MINVEQKSFFDNEKPNNQAPSAPKANIPFQPIRLDMVSGLQAEEVAQNWIYFARVLTGQGQKKLQASKGKSSFIQTVLYEAKAKKGKIDILQGMRDLLLYL